MLGKFSSVIVSVEQAPLEVEEVEDLVVVEEVEDLAVVVVVVVVDEVLDLVDVVVVLEEEELGMKTTSPMY